MIAAAVSVVIDCRVSECSSTETARILMFALNKE